MKQLRSLEVLDRLQYRDKSLDVIAIDGTEVAHTEVLEEITLVGHQRLDAVIEALKISLPRVGEEIELREPLRPHIAELIVLRTGDKLDQIPAQPTRRRVDGDVVVIEDDEDVIVPLGDVV